MKSLQAGSIDSTRVEKRITRSTVRVSLQSRSSQYSEAAPAPMFSLLMFPPRGGKVLQNFRSRSIRLFLFAGVLVYPIAVVRLRCTRVELEADGRHDATTIEDSAERERVK